MLSVSIKLANDALKIDAWVGLRAAAPGRLGPDPAEFTRDVRPGSGICDWRREAELASEKAGELGIGLSGALADDKATPRTSRRNVFFVEARRFMCSSGTVSRFFSKKPSASYVTSRA
jgi:hypothetical protein